MICVGLGTRAVPLTTTCILHFHYRVVRHSDVPWRPFFVFSHLSFQPFVQIEPRFESATGILLNLGGKLGGTIGRRANRWVKLWCLEIRSFFDCIRYYFLKIICLNSSGVLLSATSRNKRLFFKLSTQRAHSEFPPSCSTWQFCGSVVLINHIYSRLLRLRHYMKGTLIYPADYELVLWVSFAA